jgi:short-subunit dehydrogenase
MNILNNKNCFITGATGGLGKQISHFLAKENCNLFLTSTDEKNLEKLTEKILLHNKNISVVYKPADLSKKNDLYKIMKYAKKKFKKIDILINCAGVFPVKKLNYSTIEEFDYCMNVNSRAPFYFIKEFSQDMIRNKWGRIVNIGSSSSYDGFKETSMYCASKHAILGLSRSVHDELKNYNIRTITISPGSIKTKMGRKVKNQNYQTFIKPKEIAKFLVDVISYDNEMIPNEVQLKRMDYE